MASGNLGELLSGYVKANGVPDLYLVSMDHSPSEQITSEQHYTSAIVLSPNVEHSKLADLISRQISETAGSQASLRKWSGSSRSYRTRFVRSLVENYLLFPIATFVLARTREQILSTHEARTNKYELSEHFKKINLENGRARIQFDPFVDEQGNVVTVAIAENQFISLLLIYDFVISIHTLMLLASAGAGATPFLGVGWRFFADILPGNVDGNMGKLFSCLIGLHNAKHRTDIVWGNFTKGDQVETDLLADNIVGYLNEKLRGGRKPISVPTNPACIFYVDRLEEI